MPVFIDITGLTFGRLTVIGLAPKRADRVQWYCRCACNAKIAVDSKSLRNGDTKSCGCLKLDGLRQRSLSHGHAFRGQLSPTYKSWVNMSRYNIEICERWELFDNFLSDMGERPKGLMLNRIDKTQGFFPENCKWTTRLQQARFTDLTGSVFGRLTVLGISHRYGKRNRIIWHCRCSCGTETKTASTADLKNSNTQSCGCLLHDIMLQKNRTHGHTSGGRWTITYQAWSGMFTRCYNPNAKSYKHYGDRGIKVCKRWRDSFENFLADMGEKPVGLTLDRIDNEGDYKPGNCRWATYSEQNKNRRKFNRSRRPSPPS